MAFVNEYISDEDVEKYGIAQLREEFHAYHQRRYHWTRDRERDAYLVQVHHLGRDLEPEYWLLYERGRYYAVRLHRGGDLKIIQNDRIAGYGILTDFPNGGTGALFRPRKSSRMLSSC